MPSYGFPGVTTTRQLSRTVGVTVTAVLAAAISWQALAPEAAPEGLRLQLRTSLTGDGIKDGTMVRFNGVQVGSVAEVESSLSGSQLVTLVVDPAEVRSLRNNVTIEYAPANLFGISEVILRQHDGGAPITQDAVIDATAPGRVTDATMSNLLRSVSETTTVALTPELSKMLQSTATNMKAFAPLMEAMIQIGQMVAETQQYPSSFLISQYGAFFKGVSSFGDGFFKLVDSVYNSRVLQTRLDEFNIGVSLVADQLLPNAQTLLETLDGYAGPLVGTFATLVGQLASMVPDPAGSHRDIAELISRIDSTFKPTPDGLKVDVELLVRQYPGIMGPILGVAAAPNEEGQR